MAETCGDAWPRAWTRCLAGAYKDGPGQVRGLGSSRAMTVRRGWLDGYTKSVWHALLRVVVAPVDRSESGPLYHAFINCTYARIYAVCAFGHGKMDDVAYEMVFPMFFDSSH